MVCDSIFCGGRVRWGGGRVGWGVFPDMNLLSESSPYSHHHTLHTPIIAMWFLHCLLLLGLAHCLAEKRRGRFKHSCYRKDFSEPSLLKRGVNAIERFHNVPWSPWSYHHGKNYLHQEMIKRTSPCLGLTANPLIMSSRNLLWCFQGTNLLMSQGWLLNLNMSKGKGEWFSWGLPQACVSMDAHQGLA